METSEDSFLLRKTKNPNDGLSVFAAILCIVDVFGVFPLITLPKTIINCGAYGILVVAVVVSAQIYTSVLLGRSWIAARKLRPNLERKNRRPYIALSEFACGRKLSHFVTVLLNVAVFGGGIPNIIVASQNFELLSQRVTSINLSYCYWMLAIGVVLCPILWLGSPKDMKLLCAVSVSIVVIVFVLVMSSLLSSTSLMVTQDRDETESVLENILIAYGVITFQFDIHPSILTVQVDLKKGVKINHAIFGGFAATLIMFTVILVTVLTTQATNLRDSLLESMPTSTGLHIAALLAALQLALSSAISNSALYQYLEDCMRISREFNYKRCLLRTSLILAAILLAEVVPKFELVMSLIGGTLTGPLVFIFPPLFYIKTLMMRSKDDSYLDLKEKTEVFVCLLVISLGVCGTLTTTYVSSASFLRYWSFSRPCIYNLTFFSK